MWNALRFASYCGSNRAFAKMPETLKKKQIRLYDHFLAAVDKPMEHPMLHKILLNNVCGRCMCRSPEEIPDDQTRQKRFSLEQRLRILEHNFIPIEKILELHYRLERVERESKQRIAMLEQRQELLARVLVKLTKRKS